MNTNYVAPQVEVIEVELEGVLCASIEDMKDGGELGDW